MTQHPAKAPSQRQLRVGEEIRHMLSAIFTRGDLHDPDLHDVSLTVTEVRVSPDLKNATAFIMPLGGGQLDETLAALKRAAPFLRSQVARDLRLRHAPRLSFQPDTSFDQAERINRLLHSGQAARDIGYDRRDGDGEDDDGTAA